MWVSHCLEFVLRRGLEFVYARDFESVDPLQPRFLL